MGPFNRTMPQHAAATPEGAIESVAKARIDRGIASGEISPSPQLGDVKERKQTVMSEGRASNMLMKNDEDTVSVSRKRLLGS